MWCSVKASKWKVTKITAESGGKAAFSFMTENHYIIICTSLMLRAQEVLEQSKEILVDLYSGIDKEKHRL